MDTKSKRWRPAVSFLTFVLGVSLLLGSCFTLITCLTQVTPPRMVDAFRGDFQKTMAFREGVTWVLDDLLALASVAEPDAEAQVEDTNGNILYLVKQDGKVLFASSALLGGKAPPDQYNFLLTFDGSKVDITWNEKQVDVYGDGYYRGDYDWRVPGYQNYPVSGEFQDITVQIAALKEPVPYLNRPTPVSTPVSASQRFQDSLYYASQEQVRLRVLILLLILLPLALGLLFFVWYLVWRRHKAEADRAIARVAGHIWLEFKLVLLPFLYIGWWISAHELFNTLFYSNFRSLSLLTILPVSFWVTYLYLNDLRYNGTRVFRHSGCAALVRLLWAGSMKYPAQTRMERRANLGFLLALPAMAATGLFGLYKLFGAFSSGWYYRIISWGILGLIWLALMAGLVLLLQRNRKSAADLGMLLDRIEAVHRGDLSSTTPLPADSVLWEAAEALNDLQGGLRTALEEQTRSERMKVELIANVSHDLKTPLTSIISYAELLSREENLPDHVRDYVNILNLKAERLKSMVQEVFEVSKAASGNLPVQLEALDLAKLLRQTLADMEEPITHSGLTLRTQLPLDPVWIVADGNRLYRVFQNLVQNALQYALDGSRLFLSLRMENGRALAVLQNTSRDELPDDIDFTGRFVRGDESRTDGGSGLGLSIARTFTEACGGQFRVEVMADLFTTSVDFPLTARRPTETP